MYWEANEKPFPKTALVCANVLSIKRLIEASGFAIGGGGELALGNHYMPSKLCNLDL